MSPSRATVLGHDPRAFCGQGGSFPTLLPLLALLLNPGSVGPGEKIDLDRDPEGYFWGREPGKMVQ